MAKAGENSLQTGTLLTALEVNCIEEKQVQVNSDNTIKGTAQHSTVLSKQSTPVLDSW